MLRRIAIELGRHAPFTAAGAVSGIIIMSIVIFANVSSGISEAIFYTLHPAHVVLSAIVTTAMYKRYRRGGLWAAILIGYTASVGIATLHDSIVPYLAGTSLSIRMEFHVPFIETGILPVIGVPSCLLINSAAAVGIALGFLLSLIHI